MKSENALETAIGFFGIIVVGALVSAILGGVFGAIIALISPEFVGELFSSAAKESLGRYSFVVGMIWGLFIGAAVSCGACFLASIIKILKVRFEYEKNKGADKKKDDVG